MNFFNDDVQQKNDVVILVGLPAYKLDLFNNLSKGYSFVLLVEPETALEHLDLAMVVKRVSFTDTHAMTKLFEQLSARYHVIACVANSEASMMFSSYVNRFFNLDGVSPEQALSLRNKHLMAQALAKYQVKIPQYSLLDGNDIEASIKLAGGFPLISKPLAGFASQGVIRSDNMEQLKRAVTRTRRENKFVMKKYYQDDSSCHSLLIQQYLSGEEVAIDGYIHNHQFVGLVLAEKPHLSQGPYFDDRMHVLTPCTIVPLAPELQQICQQAAGALGLNNMPMHIEVRKHNGQCFVFELAARLGFITSLNLFHDINPINFMVDLALGKKPNYHLKDTFSGSYCISADKVGKFSGIKNSAAVVAIPSIEKLVQIATTNALVVAPPMGSNYLAMLFANAKGKQMVIEALECARTTLDYEIISASK